MSEDRESPFPTPTSTLSPTHPPSSTSNKKTRRRAKSAKSPPMTTITLDDTGLNINSQDVREQTFRIWLEGKKNKNTDQLSSPETSSEPVDVVISSSNVRETVVHNWLVEKERKLARREREKRFQALDQKRLLEAELSFRQEKSVGVYESWCKGKDARKGEKVQLARRERERWEEEKVDSETKRGEASRMYGAWLEQADRRKREELKRERESASGRVRREQEDKEMKRAESLKMYQAWCVRKDALLKEEARAKRDREIRRQQLLERERREKSENAVRAYEAWLEWKEGENSPPNELSSVMPPPTESRWKPAGPYLNDYPRSYATREMDTALDGRRDQLRVTTAKHSATALSAT